VLPEDAKEKPRTASLFASMSPETVTLEDALRLLTLPRMLEAPDGEEILVSNGRYGPFVKKGSETRSLASEDQLLTLTVEEALDVLAKPKERRGRGAPKPPLRELGPDPVSGRAVVLKEGRFGPYVTDGETNASLRRGDDPESVTIERAAELIAERRSKGPAPKRRAAPARRRKT
jgi:DNA topoisomerase-1